MAETLATKYRPKTWEDVTEQSEAVTILRNQLDTNTFKHAYLFCGPAGCGKTTCARILASDINKGAGAPLELDAASNSSVDDVREVIQLSKTKSIDSEYKVFIIDECHSLSDKAWQAFLKLIEEPPVKSIFIFCTTDPQKIPKTILSRVQRYDFQRISQKGIVNRLWQILDSEGYNDCDKLVDIEPLEYIAKIADGGMRDAITLMDKCLAYSSELTLENVVKIIGNSYAGDILDLYEAILGNDSKSVMTLIESKYAAGADLKLYMKDLLTVAIDICKYKIDKSFDHIKIPRMFKDRLDSLICSNRNIDIVDILLTILNEIKWETSPCMLIEAELLVFMRE